jgi:DNA mismatch repair protein MLH3
VKFGDKLTPEQCVTLMQQLARCRFPFQCAHGRPSLLPLASLPRTCK